MAFIETERLILRTWMHDDVQALFEISRDPEVNRFLPLSHPPTEASISAWIDRAIAEQEHEGFSVWPVVRKDTGKVIGRCGLHRMDDGEVEVAWIFAREQWGNGFATEAARAALDYGKNISGLQGICALVSPSNSASVAVTHRLSMRFDRVVRAYKRDLLRYLTP